MIPLIAILLFASVAFAGYTLAESVSLRRERVRGRILPPTGEVMPRSFLRQMRGRVPIVDALPISPIARQRLQNELDRAGQPLRVSEYLGLRVFCAFALAVAFGALLAVLDWFPLVGALIAAFVGLAAGWMLPRWYLKRLRERRLVKFEQQLPDALTAIAKSLRSGTGLLQALSYSANETPDPLGQELRSALRDLQLGADPDQVFTQLAERVGSSDMDIAATAIIIQRTIGGNLSEILSNVTNTIREREELRGEIRVITSRQRLTSMLVAILPVALAGAFLLINRDMGSLLFTRTAGQIALVIGAGFELLGIWLVKRLATVEV